MNSVRKDGREVEGGGLENRYPVSPGRGFESPSFRLTPLCYRLFASHSENGVSKTAAIFLFSAARGRVLIEATAWGGK